MARFNDLNEDVFETIFKHSRSKPDDLSDLGKCDLEREQEKQPPFEKYKSLMPLSSFIYNSTILPHMSKDSLRSAKNTLS